MQTAGTSTFANPFCRRASRSSAAGRNTDGADGFLLSSSGGISKRSFKNSAVVIRRDLNTITKLKAAWLNGSDGLFRRHAQFRRRATRLAEDRRGLARSRVPTHDSKQTAGLQNIVDGSRKTRLVWNAMERIGEEHVVNRRSHDLGEVVGIGLDKRAIGCAATFGNPHLRCAR